MQETFDTLYKQSESGSTFKHLYEIIISEENIKLAYRNIKANKGSKTKGINDSTILNIKEQDMDKIINYVKGRLGNYKPEKVRRVYIPKPNGKLRPLGIPTIEDRLIQQCILQVLEPICEAKFHNHSYGFRPNRNTEHAISRMLFLNNLKDFHYIVDIDIKGFFDNVDHGKLLKQMWSLGIQDKRVISIISKLLKAEIEGEGIPVKGVPQGGIISPLLSNIVLNELDWWISNQWETLNIKKDKPNLCISQQNRRKHKTNLKQIYLVRYADDFKIVCKNYNVAKKIKIATTEWLKERLKLDVSEEKTKITNLKRNYSEFLGFKFTLRNKGTKQIIRSHLSDKAIETLEKKVKARIKDLKEHTKMSSVQKYNAMVLGMHRYYSIATDVSADFKGIGYSINRALYNQLNTVYSNSGKQSKAFLKYYKNYTNQIRYICDTALFPITGIKFRKPMCFNQNISNYTIEGRKLIHDKLQIVTESDIRRLLETTNENRSIEFNDNRISLYVAQDGKCGVSKNKLNINEMEVHHKKMGSDGGTDAYKNLIILHKHVHKLVHATEEMTITKYLRKLSLNKTEINKLNKLRKDVGNFNIIAL